jgi:hypothetical protein
VLRGCCSKAIAGHDMLTERMRHMIDDVFPGGFRRSAALTRKFKTNLFVI